MKNNEDTKLAKEISEIAAHSIKITKKIFGIELDYSEKSVNKIEEIVNTFYVGRKEVDNWVYSSMGAVLGEIMRRNIGGEWSHYDYQGQKVAALVNFTKKFEVVFPIEKVVKRFKNGKEDDLVFYYHVLKSSK